MRWFTVPKSLKDEFVGKPVDVFEQGTYRSQSGKYRYPLMRVNPKTEALVALQARIDASKDFSQVRILVAPHDIGSAVPVPGRLNISIAEKDAGKGNWIISHLGVG